MATKGRTNNGKLAFALGGLGGANSHGVGFLRAANEVGIQPNLISCTSGMIVWTAHYLAGHDLDAMLRAEIDEDTRFAPPFQDLNSIVIGALGLPGIFRPAYREYFQRWLQPLSGFSFEEWANRALPAQWWVPTRSDADFDWIAETLNDATVPVFFNSLKPAEGIEYLYINEAARKALDVQYDDTHEVSVFKPITAGAVKAALWLYQYGFDEPVDGDYFVDGAYHRQFIIRELCDADVIFVPRPEPYKWLGHLPRNYFEAQDFTTQLLFNASYAGETNKVRLINKCLAEGTISPERYHPIDLVEVNTDTQIGYFDYFVEKEQVYLASYEKALEVLKPYRKRRVA